MNYFADSAFEMLQAKVQRLREKASLQKRLIITTSAFPADVVLDLGKVLDAFVLSDGQADLVYRIAGNLGQQWLQQQEPAFQELQARGWIDTSGNLTGYRNAPPPANGKLGLVVLVGADKVTDASGLQDFFRCDPASVWLEQMEESFGTWTRKRLQQAHVAYDDATVDHFDLVLKSLVSQGCADLFQIARLLRDLPLEAGGAQDGKDAEQTLLKGLRDLRLPSFCGFSFTRRKALVPYLTAAVRFFRYDIFLEESTRTKALAAVQLLQREKATEIEDNSLFKQEERGTFGTDREFIETVGRYVEVEDREAREDLFHSDFVTVHDRILRFRVKSEREPKETVRRLSGSPVDVALTAIWHALRDCRRDSRGTRPPELRGIRLQGQKFRHDNEGLSDGQNDSAAEKQIRALEYLRRLVHGVDQYFANGYLESSGYGDEEIEVHSSLYNEDVVCTHARTAEPMLEFTVELALAEGTPFTRRYAWRLPEIQSFRIAEELIQWAAEGIVDKATGYPLLPVFHIRYHEELIRAKDDDETRRVLLHAIRDISTTNTNLLSEGWRNDPLFTYLRELALQYRQFLTAARTNGLHSIFHRDAEGRPAEWELLRQRYENASRAFQGEDDQCCNSPMGAMLMRAFLIVASRDSGGDAWVADAFERSGVATVLHPCVLEMLCDRNAYLFSCFNYAASREWKSDRTGKAFSLTQWQDYLDLATIQMPLAGLISDENLIVDTQVRGEELIHRVGSPADDESPLSTRLLLRYEGFDDDDIADSEMFAESRESRLLEGLLGDYLSTHPHARDGVSVAIYRNQDIQPVISAVHAFLAGLAKGDSPVLSPDRQRPYTVSITVFTEAGEDVGIARWIEQWKERWEAAETEDKYEAYRYCRFSIAHRVVPGQEKDRKAFARMIRDGLDVDIAVFYDFIGAGLSGNEFKRVDPYDVRERTLKFPIVEKSFCMVEDPSKVLRRARVISNPQFRLPSLHLETMARLKNQNTPAKQEHVLVGYGDFGPWQEVVDELHKRSEWVVCIDPSIDDSLIKTRRDSSGKEREIIGFGSGVGLHGELNFTVSTEHFGLSDVRFRLARAIAERYPQWRKEDLDKVTDAVIRQAQSLSGLSLVRATGVGTYLHDFLAYCLVRKLLIAKEDLLCSHLVSLDAYRHWFAHGDSTRPDLLWMAARLDEDGRVALDMHVLECKLGSRNEDYLTKAIGQVQNGLATLVPAFMPRQKDGGDDSRPDQRYWWLQLHRLIASKTKISRQRLDSIMAAMERLAEGDYSIAWHSAVVAFWTDSDGMDVKQISDGHFTGEEGTSVEIPVFAVGSNVVLRVCTGDGSLQLEWPEAEPAIGTPPAAFPFNPDRDSVEAPVAEPQGAGGTDAGPNVPPTVEPAPSHSPQVSDPSGSTVRIPDRILLGKASSGSREVYWEFGHRELCNRHLLVFGTSGMGKTYAIQCILCELGRLGQNSLVMDYTNGFLPNQLEVETKSLLSPHQHIVRQSPLPISPFKLQVQDIGDGLSIPETAVTAAKRIAGTFSQVYDTLGDQQHSVLLDCIMASLDSGSNGVTMDFMLEVLESFVNDGRHDRQKVQTVVSKLNPFVMDKPFAAGVDGLDWGGIFSDPEHRCHVFQFAGMDPVSSRLVIEFALWDLNSFVRGTGNKNLPKVVVLDEVQNLDLSEQSPVSKYLTEGRKFGLSLVLATQTTKNIRDDKLARLFQAGHKLFFRPADTELADHANLVARSVGGSQQEWIAQLSSLTKGQCYSVGPSLNTATGTLEQKAFKINITPLGGRFTDA